MSSALHRSITVTGTFRSGTTLVERLLDQHPAMSVASQPFPFLWIEAKRAFLASRRRDDALPLGHLFRDPDHDPTALSRFLREWPCDGERVAALIREQKAYSGAMTPDIMALATEAVPDADFTGLLAWVYGRLARRRGTPDVTLAGAKEILVEEFVPALLDAGHEVVVVIRDPRAVVASSTTGRGEEYVGSPRPTLLTLRIWRKSVAFALAYAEHPRCHVVRFEDLLDSEDQLRTLWSALGVDPGVELPDPLRDQEGEPWQANTSFRQAAAGSTAALQRARNALSTDVLGYVEAATYPELVALGYPVDPPTVAALRAFREPERVTRSGVAPDYSCDPLNVAEEVRRLEIVTDDLPPAEAVGWFLHVATHARLRDAVGAS